MSTIAVIPSFAIEVRGSKVSDEVLRSVEEIRVSQKASAPAQCEILLGKQIDKDFSRGDSLKVSLGSADAFAGNVVAIEREYVGGAWRTRVRAYDRMYELRKRQPVRAHVQVGLNELAEELLRDLDITLEGTTEAPLWQRYIQFGQSDFDLLADVAERAGQYFVLERDTLRFFALSPRDPDRTLTLGRDLLEASVEENDNDLCSTAVVHGWDPSHISINSGNASATESGIERTVITALAPDASHASTLARMELTRRTASERALWGLVEGDVGLRPGIAITVRGGGTGLDETHVVTSVTHVIDRERGYISEISSAVPARRPARNGFFITPGKVTRIDDPENLGRVRVSLSAANDVETDWMNVVAPMAGRAKGFMSIPDAGDEVICCCSAENPAYGVVLGAVYGSVGVPDCGIENGAVARFTLRTPGGHRLQFDDAKQTLRLETLLGSFVEMSPLKTTLHAASDLTLEAPGHAVIVRGQSIDFRRG